MDLQIFTKVLIFKGLVVFLKHKLCARVANLVDFLELTSSKYN